MCLNKGAEVSHGTCRLPALVYSVRLQVDQADAEEISHGSATALNVSCLKTGTH